MIGSSLVTYIQRKVKNLFLEWNNKQVPIYKSMFWFQDVVSLTLVKAYQLRPKPI